jgi:hypothetical protein
MLDEPIDTFESGTNLQSNHQSSNIWFEHILFDTHSAGYCSKSCLLFFSGYIPQIVIITRLATSFASLAQTSSSISETTTSPVPRTQGLWCRGNKCATRPPPLPSTGHVSHLIFSELANTNPPYNIPNFWWYLSTP